MAVEVRVQSETSGTVGIERHDQATDWRVGKHGNLLLTDRSNRKVALYVHGTWLRAVNV